MTLLAAAETPPEGVPVSGIDPFAMSSILDPFSYHEELREAGPLVWLDKWRIYATGRYDECIAITSDPATYCSSGGVGYTNFFREKPWRPPSLLLEADPPEHTRRRAVVGRILSAPNLRHLRAGFEQDANRLIDRVLAKGNVEVVTEIAQAYALKVFPDAVGMTPQGRESLLTYGNAVFCAFGPMNEVFHEAMRGIEPVAAWIIEHCRREHLEPGKLGDQVYQAADRGEIPVEEAPVLVRSFLSAGVDSTIDAIGNALNAFALHPEQWAKVVADPAKVKNAFEEVLRWDSPFQAYFRTTTREIELAGVRLPVREKVMLSPGAANRDGRRWERPNAFDVERKTTGHVGFGHGVHTCIGQMIARLEIDALLTEMAKRKLSFEITGKPRRRINNTLHGFGHMPMRFGTA